VVPGQLQSGHHHDGPELADRTYIEPVPGVGWPMIERSAPRHCCRQWADKPPQCGDGLQRDGVLDRYGVNS